jgi:hypothetical protein
MALPRSHGIVTCNANWNFNLTLNFYKYLSCQFYEFRHSVDLVMKFFLHPLYAWAYGKGRPYSLKLHLGLPCPTLLCPAGRPPLKWPYNSFRSGQPAGWAACGLLLPLCTPYVVRLWSLIRPNLSWLPQKSRKSKNHLFINSTMLEPTINYMKE